MDRRVWSKTVMRRGMRLRGRLTRRRGSGPVRYAQHVRTYGGWICRGRYCQIGKSVII